MFQKITEHIHMRRCQHYTDRPNIGYIRGERAALLFDAGNSGANVAQLKGELEAAQPRQVGVLPSLAVGRNRRLQMDTSRSGLQIHTLTCTASGSMLPSRS